MAALVANDIGNFNDANTENNFIVISEYYNLILTNLKTKISTLKEGSNLKKKIERNITNIEVILKYNGNIISLLNLHYGRENELLEKIKKKYNKLGITINYEKFENFNRRIKINHTKDNIIKSYKKNLSRLNKRLQTLNNKLHTLTTENEKSTIENKISTIKNKIKLVKDTIQLLQTPRKDLREILEHVAERKITKLNELKDKLEIYGYFLLLNFITNDKHRSNESLDGVESFARAKNSQEKFNEIGIENENDLNEFIGAINNEFIISLIIKYKDDERLKDIINDLTETPNIVLKDPRQININDDNTKIIIENVKNMLIENIVISFHESRKESIENFTKPRNLQLSSQEGQQKQQLQHGGKRKIRKTRKNKKHKGIKKQKRKSKKNKRIVKRKSKRKSKKNKRIVKRKSKSKSRKVRRK